MLFFFAPNSFSPSPSAHSLSYSRVTFAPCLINIPSALLSFTRTRVGRSFSTNQLKNALTNLPCATASNRFTRQWREYLTTNPVRGKDTHTQTHSHTRNRRVRPEFLTWIRLHLKSSYIRIPSSSRAIAPVSPVHSALIEYISNSLCGQHFMNNISFTQLESHDFYYFQPFSSFFFTFSSVVSCGSLKSSPKQHSLWGQMVQKVNRKNKVHKRHYQTLTTVTFICLFFLVPFVTSFYLFPVTSDIFHCRGYNLIFLNLLFAVVFHFFSHMSSTWTTETQCYSGPSNFGLFYGSLRERERERVYFKI